MHLFSTNEGTIWLKRSDYFTASYSPAWVIMLLSDLISLPMDLLNNTVNHVLILYAVDTVWCCFVATKQNSLTNISAYIQNTTISLHFE